MVFCFASLNRLALTQTVRSAFCRFLRAASLGLFKYVVQKFDDDIAFFVLIETGSAVAGAVHHVIIRAHAYFLQGGIKALALRDGNAAHLYSHINHSRSNEAVDTRATFTVE